MIVPIYYTEEEGGEIKTWPEGEELPEDSIQKVTGFELALIDKNGDVFKVHALYLQNPKGTLSRWDCVNGFTDMELRPEDIFEIPDILSEAFHTINGERQDQYGKPEDSFRIIASFWNTYLRYKGKLKEDSAGISAVDIAHMMSLFKHARMIGQKFNRDNYVDACGYLAIAADKLLQGDKNEGV